MVSQMMIPILQVYAYCAAVLRRDKLQKLQVFIMYLSDGKERIDVPQVDDEAVPSRFLGNHERWRDVVGSAGKASYCPSGNVVREE